ncbi:DUF695 domain-containing protein [Flavobacterium selenitireducens]|uniref:DUF695 domain-containing protein n=1 Tax=Flavobacterium selenitireducens TaxID=2722704 RepID=UPI00168AA1D7|nr:DUF695 domain-containing protein [Flavobacterium selenitireducens]MBD3582518.1 DUF695 domain-containing protein [Flavobacterium selenitireducens]
MKFLKLFRKPESIATNYAEFWAWFTHHEAELFRIIRKNNDIERNFLDRVFAQLSQINSSIFLLAGMSGDNQAELVFSPDGSIGNIVFTEELVAAAPHLKRWKFTALKPAINDVSIDYSGYVFSVANLSFSVRQRPEFPDEINLAVIFPDFTESEKDNILNGVMIFLDNFLGELETVTQIDAVAVIATAEPGSEIIPMSKLPDYLNWREKEFVEKYEGRRKNTQNDRYTSTEVLLDDGSPILSLYNSDLLEWDAKASHPWILHIEIEYDGLVKNGGMPDVETYALMDAFEQLLMDELRDANGYLNVGRETGCSLREIFFACKEFRHASRKVSEVIANFADTLPVFYTIYKDKYWHSLERFRIAEDDQGLDETDEF